MKFSRMLLWSVLLVAGVPQAWAQANSVPSQPHLLVKGQAKREVLPDQFGISVALSSIDSSPEVARQRAEDNAAQILSSFKRHHAIQGSIEASSLNITPEYGVEGGKRVFKGTRVSRRLSAKFGSLEDLRHLLAETRTSEEVLVSGITTAFSGEAKVRSELKAAAAEQTRGTARQLAAAYGVRLGGLYTISEVAPNFAYGIQAGNWPVVASGSRAVPPPAPPAPPVDIEATAPQSLEQALAESLEAGSITLSENIYAIFLIAQ